ncbi:hypothetical protein X975_20307, partial [Stegodyphus mimosarum]
MISWHCALLDDNTCAFSHSYSCHKQTSSHEKNLLKMLSATIVFLLVVIRSFAVPVSDKNSLHVEPDPDLENYLREALENFREQMKSGIPSIKMPVLDPLHLQNLDINVYENLATMTLKIKELTVSCLSLFNVSNLQPNLEEFFLRINLSLPEIYVKGHYNVNGRLLKIFPIYGQGYFNINATEISIAGTGQLGFTSDTMQMSLLKLDLHWEHLAVFMENFLGGGDFSDVLQKAVPKVGRDIFNVYKPLIMEKLESALTNKVNEKFQDPAVKNIIKSIIPK